MKLYLFAVLPSVRTTPAVPVFAADGGAMAEASSLLAADSAESSRAAYVPGQSGVSKPSDHVFVTSALAVDFSYRTATVTLPLLRGLSRSGKDVFFIVTDASDFEVARRIGVNFIPKLSEAIETPGVQEVAVHDGVMQFKGDVDSSPDYKVVPGPPPAYFPPKEAQPGAVANAEWSSLVVLPSGLVLNCQIVHNDTGSHDRVQVIDLKRRSVTLSILDGVQGARQYFHHLVTDASAPIPAVLEKGVYSPRLAQIPAFGKSLPGEKSALLGFAPVLNERPMKDPDRIKAFRPHWQMAGLIRSTYFRSGRMTPIRRTKVHRIQSMDEQKLPIREGLLISASINPPGPGNPYVGGLRPTQAIINFPVIAHPELPPR